MNKRESDRHKRVVTLYLKPDARKITKILKANDENISRVVSNLLIKKYGSLLMKRERHGK